MLACVAALFDEIDIWLRLTGIAWSGLGKIVRLLGSWNSVLVSTLLSGGGAPEGVTLMLMIK